MSGQTPMRCCWLPLLSSKSYNCTWRFVHKCKAASTIHVSIMGCDLIMRSSLELAGSCNCHIGCICTGEIGTSTDASVQEFCNIKITSNELLPNTLNSTATHSCLQTSLEAHFRYARILFFPGSCKKSSRFSTGPFCVTAAWAKKPSQATIAILPFFCSLTCRSTNPSGSSDKPSGSNTPPARKSFT